MEYYQYFLAIDIVGYFDAYRSVEPNLFSIDNLTRNYMWIKMYMHLKHRTCPDVEIMDFYADQRFVAIISIQI